MLGWNEEGTAALIRHYFHGPENFDTDSYEVYDFKKLESIRVFDEVLGFEKSFSIKYYKETKDIKSYEQICLFPFTKANKELKNYHFTFMFDDKKCGIKDIKLKTDSMLKPYPLDESKAKKILSIIKLDKSHSSFSKNMINFIIQTSENRFKAVVTDKKNEILIQSKDF